MTEEEYDTRPLSAAGRERHLNSRAYLARFVFHLMMPILVKIRLFQIELKTHCGIPFKLV